MGTSLFIDYYDIDKYLSPSPSYINYTEIISIIIAVIALIFSVHSIKVTKKKEIEYDKFKRLALELLSEHFSDIERKMNLYKSNTILLAELSDSLTNLTLFFNSMQTYYPKMDIDIIQDEIIEFSDRIYISKSNIEFYRFIHLKANLYALIYDYAIGEIPSSSSLQK